MNNECLRTLGQTHTHGPVFDVDIILSTHTHSIHTKKHQVRVRLYVCGICPGTSGHYYRAKCCCCCCWALGSCCRAEIHTSTTQQILGPSPTPYPHLHAQDVNATYRLLERRMSVENDQSIAPLCAWCIRSGAQTHFTTVFTTRNVQNIFPTCGGTTAANAAASSSSTAARRLVCRRQVWLHPPSSRYAASACARST